MPLRWTTLYSVMYSSWAEKSALVTSGQGNFITRSNCLQIRHGTSISFRFPVLSASL